MKADNRQRKAKKNGKRFVVFVAFTPVKRLKK